MAEPFARVTSAVIPLPIDNVDTDQIIPARYLKTTDKEGLAEGLFHDWRFTADGSLKDPVFVIDRPEMAGRHILMGGENFGCGSSREHAPWALVAGGIRVVLSTRFGDIFRNNALKNGLLPVTLTFEDRDRLAGALALDPNAQVTVDLDTQSLTLPDDEIIHFEIDPFSRSMLLAGTDELGWLLARTPAIDTWESTHPAAIATTVRQAPSA